MKNLIPILAFSFFMLFSCEQQTKIEEDTSLEHGTEETIQSIKEGDVEIISVDGCQYIVFKEEKDTNHAYGYMAHKGNCSNPIHCHNQIPEGAENES